MVDEKGFSQVLLMRVDVSGIRGAMPMPDPKGQRDTHAALKTFICMQAQCAMGTL